MYETTPSMPTFESVLAPLLEGHLREKRAGGYRYETEAYYLEKLDDFLVRQAQSVRGLPKATVESWTAKRGSESSKTYSSRVVVVRQFSMYLMRQGIPAYVPPPIHTPMQSYMFVPYIFTFDEARRLLEEADRIPFYSRSPLRHIVMPEVLHLLYFCGLRVSEAVKLQVKDVNLEHGVLTIRDTKFGKTRLVPMSDSIVDRLREYDGRLGVKDQDAYFFPSRDGGRYGCQAVYIIFRRILEKIGINHRGRGRGPRLHDLRHTFAVHRLVGWYREGEDLNAMLPLLATYLGHQGMNGTQRYLHMTPELFPEVTETLNKSVGFVIPEVAPGKEEL